MADSKSHVVLFPFPAHGHISPFISLAARLRDQDPSLTITLISTAENIQSITSSLHDTHSYLHLYSLPISPVDHGLPANAKSLADLPVTQFIDFFEASETLLPAFESFIASLASEISKQNTLTIIVDMFLGWTVHVAHKYRTFHSIFLTCGAFGGAVYFSLWMNLPHTQTSNDPFPLLEYPKILIYRSQLTKFLLLADGKDRFSVFLQKQLSLWHKSNAMIVNSVEEFEPFGLNMLREMLRIPIRAVGPLLTSLDKSTILSEEEVRIMKWLDSHQTRSVLYVSFGSQNTILPNQMMELAMGLEECNHPFIWVIRPPIGFDLKGEFEDEWLPFEFKQRMERENKGLLIHGWAPQLRILSHKSTGGFLSHCGWNSVLESLSNGVPIVGWPLGGEQFYNVNMLVDSGLSVELARGYVEDFNVVTKEKVREAVETVMGKNEKAREMREKAEEIAKMMKMAWDNEEGSSKRGLLDFLDSARTLHS